MTDKRTVPDTPHRPQAARSAPPAARDPAPMPGAPGRPPEGASRGRPPTLAPLVGAGGGGRLPAPALGHGLISGRGCQTRVAFRGGANPARGIRGRVEGFSRSSARRLRRLLWEVDGPEGWQPYGFSLTVPGPVVGEGDFLRVVNGFRCTAKRAALPVVWRIELQRRGQPHMHCIAWAGRSADAARLGLWGWWDAVRLLGPVVWETDKGRWEADSRMALPGAEDHASKVDGLQSSDPNGWYRYLASHASKSKQAQLGWKGRQWGVWGRAGLRSTVADLGPLRDAEFWCMVRALRRLTSGRGGAWGRRVWFCRPETVQRLYQWARIEGGERNRAACETVRNLNVAAGAVDPNGWDPSDGW